MQSMARRMLCWECTVVQLTVCRVLVVVVSGAALPCITLCLAHSTPLMRGYVLRRDIQHTHFPQLYKIQILAYVIHNLPCEGRAQSIICHAAAERKAGG